MQIAKLSVGVSGRNHGFRKNSDEFVSFLDRLEDVQSDLENIWQIA